MLTRPPFLCTCGKVVPGGTRCTCQALRDRARKARFDKTRPSARQRGYTREWQVARDAFLLAFPYCRHNDCGRHATVVHHVVAHKGDKRLFWDRANWLPVCQPCHDGALQSKERRT